MKTIRIDDPQELEELRRAGARVVRVPAKPAAPEPAAPPPPDINALTSAIVQALQRAPQPAKPVAWRFDVERDKNGLIKHIYATPT